jgi:hypothetical protein
MGSLANRLRRARRALNVSKSFELESIEPRLLMSATSLTRIIRSLARTRHVSPAERFFGDLEQVGANRPLSPAGRAGF